MFLIYYANQTYSGSGLLMANLKQKGIMLRRGPCRENSLDLIIFLHNLQLLNL